MTQIIQFHPTALTTNSATRAAQLPLPPTPGNTIVVVALFDKQKIVNAAPSGFNQRIYNTGDNTNLTMWAGDRVVQTGDTGAVSFTLNVSTNSATRILLWELEGPVVWGGGSYDYDDAPTSPSISTGSSGALAGTSGLAIAVAGADSSPAWFNGSGHNFTNSYLLEAYDFTDPAGNSGIPPYAVGYKSAGISAGGESTTFQYTENPTYQEDQMIAAILVYLDQVTAASITNPSPSGTLTTQGQVTLSVDTNQQSGTLYAVIATSAAALSGIDGDDIDSGLLGDSTTSAPFSGSAGVTDGTPEITITGLAANTTYHAAIVQVNSNGRSNVQTTSFTTAAASRGVQVTLRSRATGLLNAQTLRFFTRYTLSGAAIDGGSDGLPFTCNAAGVFTLYGLTINAGPGYVTVVDPADPTKSVNIPVNFVSAV